MAVNPNKKLSSLDLSEVAPIVVDKFSTDDYYLANKWRGGQALTGIITNAKFPFSVTETGNEGGDEDGNEDGDGEDRPGIGDISILSQEVYYDNAGMARVKVTFKIYNSSKEPIDKFAFAIAPKV